VQRLLQRILEEPADLSARMVYGDALVEAGDPRGELVVAQCTLAAAGVDRADDLVDVEADERELARLAGIQRRVQQLEARFGALWTAPLELPDVKIRFRRGMPESIEIGGEVEAVAVLERLAKVTPIGELTLRHGCRVAGLERIASWSGLRALDVVGVELPWAVLERMIAGGSLRRLRLAWQPMDAAMVDRLARSPASKTLQRLDLSGHGELDIESIARFASSAPDLVLVLRSNRLRDEQLHALVQAVPRLRGLDVRDNPLTVAALRELVALPCLRRLGFDPGRDVNHDKAAVGRVVAKATAPLRSLALGGAVNDAGLAAIAAVPRLVADVRAIDLRNDRPGKIGAAGDAAIASMRALMVLHVRGRDALGLELRRSPVLAYFDCVYGGPRGVNKQLAAHYGSSVPAYREQEPTHASRALERRVMVPDEPGISIPEIGNVLRAARGLAIEERTIAWLVRDPKVAADPIAVTLKKLPNKPRYITLCVLAPRRDGVGGAARRARGCAGEGLRRRRRRR
jgi:uncharacterized protein (TIGR02996 family)